MGVLLSRFKRKKTTLEILESLEKSIKSIEENQLHTEQKQRTIVGHLILYSVGVYVIAAVLFYFLCFPASLQDQLFYITPLLIFPIIVILVKRLVTWYYRRKLTHSQEKLHDMKEKKKQILEDVMDNETYKVAKEILEKFAPDQLRKSSNVGVPTRFGGSPDLSVIKQAALAVRNTSTALSSPTVVTSASSFASLNPGADLRRRSLQQPPGPVRPPVSWDPAGHFTHSGQTNGQGFMSRPAGPMLRPILPRDRSYLDKLVEYLVGDGPSNRYALICKQCMSHNGMALKEEFEYLAFRCCYCFSWNPARKQRPQAPRLPSGNTESEFSGHRSSSEVESASDTEEESGSDQSSVSELTMEGGIKISEVDSGNDQSFVSESTAKEGSVEISEVNKSAAEGQVQLEPDVAQSTDDKPFSSDTADTEITGISDS